MLKVFFLDYVPCLKKTLLVLLLTGFCALAGRADDRYRHSTGWSVRVPAGFKVVYEDKTRVNIARVPKGLHFGPGDVVVVKVYPNPKSSPPNQWYETDSLKIEEAQLFVPLDSLVVTKKSRDNLNGVPCYVVEHLDNMGRANNYYLTQGRQAFEISQACNIGPRSELDAIARSFQLDK